MERVKNPYEIITKSKSELITKIQELPDSISYISYPVELNLSSHITPKSNENWKQELISKIEHKLDNAPKGSKFKLSSFTDVYSKDKIEDYKNKAYSIVIIRPDHQEMVNFMSSFGSLD